MPASAGKFWQAQCLQSEDQLPLFQDEPSLLVYNRFVLFTLVSYLIHCHLHGAEGGSAQAVFPGKVVKVMKPLDPASRRLARLCALPGA